MVSLSLFLVSFDYRRRYPLRQGFKSLWTTSSFARGFSSLPPFFKQPGKRSNNKTLSHMQIVNRNKTEKKKKKRRRGADSKTP